MTIIQRDQLNKLFTATIFYRDFIEYMGLEYDISTLTLLNKV